MPLHLLGKKSWNVYNTDNIERVRRDEAAAKAAEEAEEQCMQEVDAQRRLAILRGEVPPPLPEPEEKDKSQSADKGNDVGERLSYPGTSRKKRKRAGEDDTEFELRLANEKFEPVDTAIEKTRKPTSQAPITDRAGHIDLFGEDGSGTRTEKNQEAEREKEKKKREFEDQYTMRFSNAAGKKGLEDPWYHKADTGQAQPMKDVWGNEDPKRKDRDAQRMVSNDPLAMMKKGASKVRELKKERKRDEEERYEELKQLRKEQDRKDRRRQDRSRSRDRSPRGERRRRRRSRDKSADDSHRDREKRRHRERHDDDRHRRHRSRSPERRRHHHRRET